MNINLVSDRADCNHVGVLSFMSHVIPILGANSGVVGAVGGEEACGTYAELKILTGIPRSIDKAGAVVPLLEFSIALSINAGVADIGGVLLAHRLFDAREHRWHTGARDEITIGP